MLDLLGYVTSTVSSCQLSGVCVLPAKSMCIIYMICIGQSHIQQCEMIVFDILSKSCFVFVLCTNFFPLWNQYTDSAEQ